MQSFASRKKSAIAIPAKAIPPVATPAITAATVAVPAIVIAANFTLGKAGDFFASFN